MATKYNSSMPYEDPIEAALRALTGIEWRKRQHTFEGRGNKTHMRSLEQILGDHHIAVETAVSEARSGRYIAVVQADEVPRILKAVQVTGARIKPHRRKRDS